MADLKTAAAAAEAWLVRDALPLWSRAGVADDGGFHEQLGFDGRPDAAAPRRMRVQARQIHVFAEAGLRGWLKDGAALALSGFDAMMARYWAPDGRPGFAHLAAPDGALLDDMRDAYDHAFGLFAMAWLYRATGEARVREAARRTVAFLDEALAEPVHGGFLESLPPKPPRRSNPHMHLLEAWLAWNEADPSPDFRVRAEAVTALFRDRFFDPASGTLGEYFTHDWRPAEGAPGRVVEPGHHLEWAWLLDWAARSGVRSAEAEAERLYDFALAHGLDASGLAVDECDRTGRQTRRSRRAWPQTELIKGHLAMAARGRAGAGEAAAAAALTVLRTYLGTEVAGLWTDQFGPDGEPLSKVVPASTLYHVVVAFRELVDRARAA